MTKTQPKTRRAGASDLSDQQKAELQARAEALAAEYSARLPEGDAGLIEAERRLQEYRPRETLLYREFNIGFEVERDIIIPTIRSAQNALIDHIEKTAPLTMVGVAVKLRRLCDEDTGMAAGENQDELASLGQVLEFVEREAGVAPEVAAPASIIKEAYQIVNDMEDDLEDARVFADGVAILAAEALHDDPKLGAVFVRHGWQIARHCEALEERRGELFRLLHPNRDHFEKEGWPGDKEASTELRS